jgi:hypothetical protein
VVKPIKTREPVDKHVTWGDLKEFIEALDDSLLSEPVEAILRSGKRNFLVEEVQNHGEPVLVLMSDSEDDSDDDTPDRDNGNEDEGMEER